MNLRINFATGKYGSDALQRYRMRMSAALVLSLLFHAFLLSLQFGIRGLGLPDLHMPWEERRAQTPGITVHIADIRHKDTPNAASQPEPRPTETGALAPDMTVSPPSEALTQAAPVTSPSPPSQMRVVQRNEAPAVAARNEGRKIVPAKPRRRARRMRHSTPSPKPHPPIVAKKPAQHDAFVLPPPDEGEASKQQPTADENVTEMPLATPSPAEESPAQPENTVEAARMLREEEDAHRAEDIAAKRLEEERRMMELEAQRQAEETAARQAAQRRAEAEQARLAAQLQAQRLAEENAQRQAAERQARRQAEEAAWQAAQRIKEEERLRAQQQQTKMLEEENARRLAMAEEARRQAMERLAEENARRMQQMEMQKLEAARAKRLAEEQEARRRAEEAARKQEAAFAEQQRRGTEDGQDRSQGASTGQHGGGPVARQAEHIAARTEKPMHAPIIEEKSSRASGTDDGAIELSDEQMASMGAVQVRKVEVTSKDTQATGELINAAQDSRRRSIFGSEKNDIVLKMYIADWLQAVERNGKLNDTPSSKAKPYGDSLVTVTLRSDGRVESVTIHRSNGHTRLDETVRRIVQAGERYKAFPPDLIRRYDVIEIRRIWRFGDGLRILEEVK